jgi:Tol biopolymer transport system component
LIGSPELSPDERSIAVFFQPRGDNEVAIIDDGRSLPRLLTNGPPADAHPLWDPGGRTIVFTSSRVGRGGGPVRMPADGSGEPSPLFAMPTPGVALSWTVDGRFVLLRREGASGSADLVAVSADGRDTIPVAQTPSDETEGQFSPDGRWVAFVSTETGRAEVYLRPFPASGGRTQISTTGGAQVRWSHDGKEIFYIAPDGQMMAVALAGSPGGPLQPAAPKALFQTFLATGTNVIGNKAQYAVARDGRFLLNTAVETASAPIIVTLDWPRTLSR